MSDSHSIHQSGVVLVIHEQEEYLSLDVESLLELGLLQDRAVRRALIALIEAQDWGRLQLVAGETCRMMGEKAIFRFPGDPGGRIGANYG